MAKAKFPGKPSKTSQITRLRVSSKYVDISNDSARISARKIALGLRIFRENFPVCTEYDCDLYGFSKVGDEFTPHYSLQIEHKSEFALKKDSHVERDKSSACATSEKQEDSSGCVIFDKPLEIHKCAPEKCSIPNVDITNCCMTIENPVNENCAIQSIQNYCDKDGSFTKRLLDRAKSPRKFVLPSKSAHSSRPIIPNKRFFEEDDGTARKKSSEDRDFGNKSLLKIDVNKKQIPLTEYPPAENSEKERMKREIERYADIMTTEGGDSRQIQDDKRKSHSQSNEKDKEEKMREKIQQLLRSQWESRLQLVDGKADGNSLSRRDQTEGRVSSLSFSSEDDTHYFNNRSVINSNVNSSARKSKIILRKARLQLNQRLLKQLRQPSRLQQFSQQLVENVPQQREQPKPVQSSILRPGQLVIPSPSPPSSNLQSPSTAKDAQQKIAPSSNSGLLKMNNVPSASEIGISNPLGCAFVMGPSDSKGLPGTVVCGVCGAVRRYSFILQARKFGTFSCEPCRKFISRVLRGRVPVKCVSQTGHCIHPPILRWNSACQPEDKPSGGEVMTSRCKACWLKLALTGFRMSESDHDDLRKLLPLEMQHMVPLAANRPDFLPWAPNRGQVIRMKAPNLPIQVPKTQKKSLSPQSSLPQEQQVTKIDKQESVAPQSDIIQPNVATTTKPSVRDKAEHCAASRTRKKNAAMMTGRSSLEIKGPRVKHVCRSAMLALGQPRAVFHNGDSQELASKHSDGTCNCCSLSESPVAGIYSNNLQQLMNSNNSRCVDSSMIGNGSTNRKNYLGSPARPKNIRQGERSHVTTPDVTSRSSVRIGLITPAARAWQQQDRAKNTNVKDVTDRKHFKDPRSGMLSLDMWEWYDTSKVWDQGFAVIGTKLGAGQMCYLCGSGGWNELVYCSCCCETFHPFCVRESTPFSRSCERTLVKSVISCNHWNKDKVILQLKRSCSVDTETNFVDECNEAANNIQSNLACLSSDDCEETKENPGSVVKQPGASWICKNCTPCHSCNSSIGERIICVRCYRGYHWSCLGPSHPSNKRRRRNWFCWSCSEIQDKYCPLCQSSIDSNQQETLLECSCCGCWIHRTCEGLTDEHVRFLRTREDVDYTCSLCDTERIWAKTVQQLLKDIYTRIVNQLKERKDVEFDQVESIRKKINQDSYSYPTDLCNDLRQLSLQHDIVEKIVLEYMPWLYSVPKKSIAKQLNDNVQTVSTTELKIKYEPESDSRRCVFCHHQGEGQPNNEGRLLYCGNDEWVHVNCALWSSEVFEELDGGLQNVFKALHRSRTSRCSCCGENGATLNCCVQECAVTFHFPCALKDRNALLLEDKRILCLEHTSDSSILSHTRVQRKFEVSRAVFVDLRPELKRVKPIHLGNVELRIGSLFIAALGQVRAEVSEVHDKLIPVGYQCQRRFWSTKDPWKLTTYTCRTVFVPASLDSSDQETNITVSHEDDDVIMAESGLNLAELDTQDDRELIHMVLEDADFEQELEGGSTSAVPVTSPVDLRDSGFYSDGHSVGETSPSPVEDHVLSLEAWLADPEHAVIFLDSALLASLDIDTVTSSCSALQEGDSVPTGSQQQHEPISTARKNGGKRRLSYSQWRKMKMKSCKAKSEASITTKNNNLSLAGNRFGLDWNGNESEWNSAGNNVVASIKVSSLSQSVDLSSLDSIPWRHSSSNILQLDGTADSSEAESERTTPYKIEQNDDEPVKCSRCRRSYRTWQSFNKHIEFCVELLSSSTSDQESEDEVGSVEPKRESEQMIKIEPRDPEPDPIQVPIVNSSSQGAIAAASETIKAATESTPKVVRRTQQRQRRKAQSNSIKPHCRPLAARLLNVQSNAQIPQVHNIQQPTPTYHLALQAPQPQLVYVTRPEMGSLFAQPTVPHQQQIYIIPPSCEQTFSASAIATPTITQRTFVTPAPLQPTFPTSALHQPQAAPVLQYLGAVPSDLVSALGMMNMANVTMTNMGVSTVPTVFQSQLHLPWETQTSNQIVVLPPQPVLFNPSPPVIPPPQASYVSIEQPQQLAVPPVVDILPLQVQEEEVQENSKATESAAMAFAALVESCCAPGKSEATTTSQDTDLEVSMETNTDNVSALPPTTCESESNKPPKPTYSYRSSMTSIRKNPRTAALISSTINSQNKDDDVSGTSSLSQFAPQQLKVVAQSSSPGGVQRTFRLKATSSDKAAASIRSETVVSANGDKCHAIDNPNSCSRQLDSPVTPSLSQITTIPNPNPSDIPESSSSSAPDLTAEVETNNGVQNKLTKAHILYEIVSDDGFYASSNCLTDVWQKLLNAVQDARLAYKLEPLPNSHSSITDEEGLRALGLHHNALRFLLEQLPNAGRCTNYSFKYHKPQTDPTLDVKGSLFGCARAAPYNGRLHNDMFNWLASQHRIRPQPCVGIGENELSVAGGRRATNFELLPMSQRFRLLKQTAQQSVGVYRSSIHGRGLFCKRDIEAGEMVVEYAGEVIRSVVCDKREKEYEAKGMGCYMFRVDDQTVVDATTHGNSARFINHSCEPNCYSRIVDISGKKHIIIFALRKILRGEELTYDYKFPIEDVKIPCTCGSRRCRKYLN